jgi:hypothetical protein
LKSFNNAAECRWWTQLLLEFGKNLFRVADAVLGC